MPSETHERPSSTSTSAARPPVNLMTKLKGELQSLQLFWWLAHLFLLYSTFRYVFGTSTFPGEAYRRALKGALVSYGIVLYKTYKVSKYLI